MTIALDSTAEAGALGTQSYTHTPVGDPDAIVVFVAGNASTTAVTYGGQSMTLQGSELTGVDEFSGTLFSTWILLASVPTGAQTVAVTGPSASIIASYALTATSGELAVNNFVSVALTSTTDPSATFALNGTTSFVAFQFGSGQNDLTNVTSLTGWTRDTSLDAGSSVFGTESFDTIQSGDVTIGATQTSDEWVYQGIALEEAAGDTTAPVLSALTASNVASTSLSLSVTTDEGNGNAYAGVWADGAVVSNSQVESGTGAVAHVGPIAVGAVGSINLGSLTGLSEATAYDAKAVQRDSAGNLSATATLDVTTSSVTRQLVLTGANDFEFRDESGTLIASASGTYEWYDSGANTNGNPVDTGAYTITSGECTITLSNSTATNGQEGTLILRDGSDSTINSLYNVTVTVT